MARNKGKGKAKGKGKGKASEAPVKHSPRKTAMVNPQAQETGMQAQSQQSYNDPQAPQQPTASSSTNPESSQGAPLRAKSRVPLGSSESDAGSDVFETASEQLGPPSPVDAEVTRGEQPDTAPPDEDLPDSLEDEVIGRASETHASSAPFEPFGRDDSLIETTSDYGSSSDGARLFSPHSLPAELGFLKDLFPDMTSPYLVAPDHAPGPRGMSPEKFRSSIIVMQASIWMNTCQEFDFRDFPVLYYEEMEVLARALDLFSDDNIEAQLFPLLRDLFDLRPGYIHVPVRHFYYARTLDRKLEYCASLRQTYWKLLLQQEASDEVSQRARALAQIPVTVLMKVMDAFVKARKDHNKRNRGSARRKGSASQSSTDDGKEQPQAATTRAFLPTTRCTEYELAEAVDGWFRDIMRPASNETETTNPDWQAFWVKEFGLEE
ncbi:hypothetical protein BR93DRAFT_936481 [Coniochaeta sp. PMI_546]|nr:hypothetical protein BR93DRAFT_936481 [Coniochaeta sp. PMI_546]